MSMLVIAELLPRLPRRVVLAIARGIGSFVYRFDHRGRALGLNNIELAMQQGGLDLKGRTPEQTLLACYQNFARGFLDLFWFSRLRAETLDRWVVIENESSILQSIRSDRGAIFLTPHYGIFEWASLIVGFRGLHFDIAAQDFKNQALTQIVRRAREHSGHRIVSRQGAMLKLIRAVKAGGSIAMLPDLNVVPQGAASGIDVFGIPACMTAAHVEISRRCGVPMFIAVCEPLEDGRAILRVIDVISASDENANLSRTELTQAVWDRFESTIRQRPELWLWMYRHWRYKPAEDGSRGGKVRASRICHDGAIEGARSSQEKLLAVPMRRAA